MFEPEKKSHLYLLLVLVVAVVIGWSVYTQYKPYLIEASCSEIAASSSNLINEEQEFLEPSNTYENIKRKCLRDSGLK